MARTSLLAGAHKLVARNAAVGSAAADALLQAAKGNYQGACGLRRVRSQDNVALKLLRFDPEAFATMKKELYTDAYRALSTGSYVSAPESRL